MRCWALLVVVCSMNQVASAEDPHTLTLADGTTAALVDRSSTTPTSVRVVHAVFDATYVSYGKALARPPGFAQALPAPSLRRLARGIHTSISLAQGAEHFYLWLSPAVRSERLRRLVAGRVVRCTAFLLEVTTRQGPGRFAIVTSVEELPAAPPPR
jgi:hypothetical protein